MVPRGIIKIKWVCKAFLSADCAVGRSMARTTGSAGEPRRDGVSLGNIDKHSTPPTSPGGQDRRNDHGQANPQRRAAVRQAAPGQLLRRHPPAHRPAGRGRVLLLHRRLPRPDHARDAEEPRPSDSNSRKHDRRRDPARQRPRRRPRLSRPRPRPEQGRLLPPVRRARGDRTGLDLVHRHQHGPAGTGRLVQGQDRQAASTPASACSPTRC